MRIGLVNDVKLALEALRRVVVSLPSAEVAWMAQHGQEAVEKCLVDTPDLVLMDLIMPVMDGVEATRQIMQQCPCPILVVTATVKGNAEMVFAALGHGALDAVDTPVLGQQGTAAEATELVRRIRNIIRLKGGAAAGLQLPSSTPATVRQDKEAVRMVAIGASTGGPQALSQVLSKLSQPPSFAVVVIQHLDQRFVPGLAQWLARETKLPVLPVHAGDRPVRGNVHLACTADHLVMQADGRLTYVCQPADHVYRPSVDVFFHSLVAAAPPVGVAALLTGMGRDGAAGLKALRTAGWRTIVQDRATSIVWGMPGAAVELEAGEAILPVHEIAAAIECKMRTLPGRARIG
jgi:two-component system response regulator WspF